MFLGEIEVMNDIYTTLKLENQLCFPLYACSREVMKKYRPHLDKLNLTYTQYITMLVMWEKRQINVKELGRILYLDSGTLTPVLKSLEAKGFVRRHRSEDDERVLIIDITPKGEKLQEEALSIPENLSNSIDITEDEVENLYTLLYKVLSRL